jgi:hypothetical protein
MAFLSDFMRLAFAYVNIKSANYFDFLSKFVRYDSEF